MMRWKVLLALLAVALHALAPLRAGAAPQQQQVELCTAHGVVTVQVDAEGGAPASPSALEHCSVCVFPAGIAAPAQALPAAPAAAAGKLSLLRPQPVVPAPARTAARPRVPPLAS